MEVEQTKENSMEKWEVQAYSFVTGLYFAILQFSYFLMLQVNISSTYITYMTVVISWMLGTLAGLWFQRINVMFVALVGLAGFYLIIFFVLKLPPSPLTLMLCIPGVFASGLWAGRFFLQALPWSKGTDSVFLHENNGFMIGVVVVFLGFTLIGSGFLKVAPVVCALLLANGRIIRGSIPSQKQ